MSRLRFSLRQLEYFVAVAESGTLSGASEKLLVSQPGLSQALGDLERALGVQLAVRRKAHGVTLTPTGTQVLQYARDLLRRAEDLENVAAGGDTLAGTLSVGCYVTLAPTALPPLMQEFCDLHPGVTIDFVEDTQDVLQRRLRQGELDLAVLYDMAIDPEMARTVISTVHPHVLLPADHRLAHATEVSLVDLADEPCVQFDAPPSSTNTHRIFEQAGVVPNVRYRPTTFETTRALVGRGMGYAVLVQRPENNHTYEGRPLVVKEIAEDVREERIVIAWPRSMTLHRRAQAFVDFCLERRAD
ncbi:LysR family transcriptional regulator [Saccharopolyspora karakumensis]|uniref:LysR family transcriptional regulator n=1 Tax=Saccharopolyspora karakumensis TaxID=2530386 RepID=A0A4R5BQE9_9PSEU|nr:LysR substrate-binding domain-containing protein [Saccharopolyspora karakumensis]TDD87726.1 LysR family transcriptional regulator [Saccharopolyspora karakumensis]